MKTVQQFIDEGRTDSDLAKNCEAMEFYVLRRLEGMSHNFAAMLACQRFPGTKTEVMYFEGRHTLASQFAGNDAQLQAVVAAAQARGYTPGTYDIYEPGLADDLGDPKAFITPSGGTTELKNKLEAAGKSSHGLVQTKRRQPSREPVNCPLAPDIVDSIVASRIANDPALAEKIRKDPRKLREAREQAVAEHGYSDSKQAGGFTSPFTQTPAEAAKSRRPLTAKARSLSQGKHGKSKPKPKRINR